MKLRFNSGLKGALFAGLGTTIALTIAIMALLVSAEAQVSYAQPPAQMSAQASSQTYAQTSAQDQAFCVDAGYLYRTSPDINGGRGICQFSDYTYCDAHAFYLGNCTPVTFGAYYPYSLNYPYAYGPNYPYGPYYPYSTYNPYTPLGPTTYNYTQASVVCSDSGGSVQLVHTPYGDVNLCVFPDGSSIDLPTLMSGAYNGIYAGPFGDSWFYYANAFLNAP